KTKEERKMSERRRLKVYLAGYMSGSCLYDCVKWRVDVRQHYENWKGAGIPYPIDFLDPFNGPELESIDSEGFKSSVPANAIFDGDLMSVKECDLVVANVSTFGHKRPMIGTFCEIGWCTAMQKPFIVIAPDDGAKIIAENHPFLGKASAVFGSVKEFLDSKQLNYFYKRINGANYKIDLEKLKNKEHING
ncbi:MAG TPA: nucleoside 2-deoxyribosyltransferase, partial [Thermodesulfobacteriota bacterium]|nr:nucleoside 2-deoxyribosyltransferase [Thermodesulfobacteriota bacterium]